MRSWLLCSSMTVMGCNVFDASLIPGEGGAAGTRGTNNAGTGGTGGVLASDGGNEIVMANDCQAALAMPAVEPGEIMHSIVAARCDGRAHSVSLECLQQPGNENFYFHFHQDRNDTQRKWHVHVQNVQSTSTNVALYILSSCQSTYDCANPNAGIQSIGDEHLSFFATDAVEDYVAVVSITVDGDPPADCQDQRLPKVLLEHDICPGAGKQHGEACDDAMDANCVECKRALVSPTKSTETNDSPLDANIVRLTPDYSALAPFVVTDSVGSNFLTDASVHVAGLDQFDFFNFQSMNVADDMTRTIHAEVEWTEAAPADCPSVSLAALTLQSKWFELDSSPPAGVTPFAPVRTERTCKVSVDFPFFSGTPIAGPSGAILSPYFVRVAATAAQTESDYTLRFSFK